MICGPGSYQAVIVLVIWRDVQAVLLNKIPRKIYLTPDMVRIIKSAPVFYICGLVLVEQATKIFIIRRVVGEYNLGTGAI
jgi:hypothetical protein